MQTAPNEFKFSTVRQFGSESVSFTATIHSPNDTLTDSEIEAQILQLNKQITKAFMACQEREISEKEILVAGSERRTAAVRKLDEALKDEMKAKTDAKKTLKEAERTGTVNNK